MLAPALFYIAIDWILSSCAGIMGTTVGSSKFTDQDYADDAVLFSDCPSKWPHILSSFDEAAHTMGLNASWLETKIQNLSHGVTPAPVQLQGHVVESTDRFTYLGSDIHSSQRSTPQILRRISLASNIFRQTGQRLEADRTEFTDKDTALQCPCHLRTHYYNFGMLLTA